MLRVLNLESGYGNLRVLKGASLHVSQGEVVALIGANGAGKTTLLATIAGAIRPRSGEIRLQGERIDGSPPERIVELGCALVPEGRQVFPTLTVRENLILGAYRPRCRASNQWRRSMGAVFELFGVLREREDQLAGTLSGGEQQMLAIGRALMSRPKLIMMDEPSMGIAPLIVKEIFARVLELRREGMTILLIEQNARAALRVADRGYVIETGQIVAQGTSRELLNNRDVQRAYLGKDYRAIDE